MEPAQLRRHTQRGVYDVASAKAVFDDCFIAHVSYVVEGEPACMPMIALLLDDDEVGDESAAEGDADGDRDGDRVGDKDEHRSQTAVYLHGHPSTKLMELVRQASQDDGPGDASPVKVCITATKVDGLVLSSAPNGHTFNYRSATIHGTCSPVRAKGAKACVMRSVTNKIVAHRWEEVNPVASMQISLVYVVRVNIDRLSVKTRAGVPGIQPRNREADGPDRDTPVWTGVVPLWEQLGEPIESGLTPGGVVSDSLRQYMDSRNEKQEAYAKRVAR